MTAPHPAPYSDALFPVFVDLLEGYDRVLDPMAGIGKIHRLAEHGHETVGIEIEPEWAEADPRTIVGDATALPFGDATFDAICVSPTYGNRLADHHNAQERCKACKGQGVVEGETCEKCKGAGRRTYQRHTYKHYIGRDLTPNNSGQMPFGPKYQRLHALAWMEANRVLKPSGLFVLNVSNFLKTKKVDGVKQQVEVDVVGWHKGVLGELGLVLAEEIPVKTPRRRHGQNYDARVECEWVFSFEKPVLPKAA